MAQPLTDTEVEVIVLKATWELIDSAVNYAVLSLVGNDPDTEIRFHTSVHQRFFNIVLVDFLSRTDANAPIPPTSYLEGLRAIARTPLLVPQEAIASLKAATDDFIGWLEQEVEIDTWFPSINIQADLNVRRETFLRITGNISKHNFLRAFRVAEELRGIFERSGITVSLEEANMALADFYERFHTDILNYHSSTIAEFLNNMRWGIYEYLQPEFTRSIVFDKDNPPMYRYIYPADVISPFARQIYWDLMNDVRSAPSMRRFRVTKWLKLRY